jgi:shikimate 5-dehydrogenase
VASNLDPKGASEFLIANIAGIRVAGRGGANRAALTGLADIALKALASFFVQLRNDHSNKERVDESGRYERYWGP